MVGDDKEWEAIERASLRDIIKAQGERIEKLAALEREVEILRDELIEMRSVLMRAEK